MLSNSGLSGDPSNSHIASGELFKVALTCPKCGESGLLDWRSLKNGIGCPKCGCQFLIGRNGRVLSQSELPHVRFACPRCKQSGWIPAMIAERGTKCPGCKLPLELGPDQRLHGAKEAEESWRITGEKLSKPSFVDRLTTKFTTGDGRVHTSFAALSAATMVGILAGAGLLLYTLFDRSPETLARRFVQVCLTGEWDAAARFFQDDAVQRVSFDRWRVRYFPSILDTHRPKGDKVKISVEMLHEQESSRVFLVTMRSPFIGSRSFVQQWHERDGDWFFDARGTLARDAAAAKPTKRGKLPIRARFSKWP